MLAAPTIIEDPAPTSDRDLLKRLIAEEVGEEVVNFISDQVDLTRFKTILLPSSSNEAYESEHKDRIRTIIDLQALNKQDNINSYFRQINSTLPDAGIYIGCIESNVERKERFFKKYPKSLAQLFWVLDFVFNRVIPKLSLTKSIHSFLFSGKKNGISRAEILGRLGYSGFEIIGHEKINGLFYFSVMKTCEPKNDKNPSYGLMFKMKRVSKDGKLIGVYKIRTMHPYSEYLQDYVVKLSGYNEVGKPNNDFRLTSWGKLIRKLHMDEIPQIINVLKGELNIVGVRPISRFGYESLPEDLQKERIKFKPGCIPPNVALGITGFDNVIKAERIYLRERKNRGYITNVKYFCMAMLNLIRRKTISA